MRRNMQSLSKYPLIRIILGLLMIGLIATGLAMELLPEEQAKIYVVPILVAALFTCTAHTFMNRK
jgi:hypothetical protein